jgi:hypothetical protein
LITVVPLMAIAPATSSRCAGVVVPMPTLPEKCPRPLKNPAKPLADEDWP